MLEPPLTGSGSAPALAPAQVSPPEPAALSDVPLLDRPLPVPDPLEDAAPPLLGPEGLGEPQPLPSPLRPGVLSLDVVPETDPRSSGSEIRPLPDRRGRPTMKDLDRNFGKDDDLPLDIPPRRNGLFKKLFPGGNNPRTAVPPPRDDGGSRASSRERERDEPEDGDPAADAAFRRQLDRAVRAAGGPHLKSQEILVRDRKVWIRLKADRVWNRRAVRKSVESLPILSGYEVRVDIE